MPLQKGQRIDRFVPLAPVQEGGMGVVWKARDERTGGYVAVKEISADLLASRSFRQRMRDEARRHQRLRHPNIVHVLKVVDDGAQILIVMEWIDGPSLAQLLEAQPQQRLSPNSAIAIMSGVLRAVDYAHQRGIIHRDIKPSNILLDRSMTPRLIDFGIALALGEHRLTQSGQQIGTPMYMSPEQILTPLQVGHLTDVYSAACVLYEMLLGRPPFVPGVEGVPPGAFGLKEAHAKRIPISPRQRDPSIPPELDRVIMAGLEKSPERRIAGCARFEQLLANSKTPVPLYARTENGQGKKFPLNAGLLVFLLFLIYLAFR